MAPKLKSYTVKATNRVTGLQVTVDVSARSKAEAQKAVERRHLYMLSGIRVIGPF